MVWTLHTVEFTKFLYHLKIISWNQLYSELFTKEIVFTEIFQKVVIQKFRKFHSVVCYVNSMFLRFFFHFNFTWNQCNAQLWYIYLLNFATALFFVDYIYICHCQRVITWNDWVPTLFFLSLYFQSKKAEGISKSWIKYTEKKNERRRFFLFFSRASFCKPTLAISRILAISSMKTKYRFSCSLYSGSNITKI